MTVLMIANLPTQRSHRRHTHHVKARTSHNITASSIISSLSCTCNRIELLFIYSLICCELQQPRWNVVGLFSSSSVVLLHHHLQWTIITIVLLLLFNSYGSNHTMADPSHHLLCCVEWTQTAIIDDATIFISIQDHAATTTIIMAKCRQIIISPHCLPREKDASQQAHLVTIM